MRNNQPEILNVDMDAEVGRLAHLDGIDSPAALELKVEVTRRVRYQDIIRSYYQGWDEGYAQAYNGYARNILRARFQAIAFGCFFGASVAAAVLRLHLFGL